MLVKLSILPAVAVWSANISTYPHKELHHWEVSTTYGIVKGCDTFIIRLAWISHLHRDTQVHF